MGTKAKKTQRLLQRLCNQHRVGQSDPSSYRLKLDNYQNFILIFIKKRTAFTSVARFLLCTLPIMVGRTTVWDMFDESIQLDIKICFNLLF